jgi:hypothetical protein
MKAATTIHKYQYGPFISEDVAGQFCKDQHLPSEVVDYTLVRLPVLGGKKYWFILTTIPIYPRNIDLQEKYSGPINGNMWGLYL